MRIPFGKEDRQRYYAILDEMFDSNFWSEGPILERFETAFGAFTGLGARAVSNGGTGLLAIFEYLNVRGGEVVVPTNTFWATTAAAMKAGADVVFADCNREDLCLSLEDLKAKVTPRTKAVAVVHIGGHIAFQIKEIAAFCEERGIALVEDCAHAHGADWNGKTGGHWGFAGSYSFYATKTMPMGEGGMVVSRNREFLDWLAKYRNYGKDVVDGVVTYPVEGGFNYRMGNTAAALGLVQLERLPEILRWKRDLAAKYDQFFERRVRFPEGMTSGYYKYVVFDYPELKERTGQVFGPGDLNHRIAGADADLPHSLWVADHHLCPPMWHGWDGADSSPAELEKRLLG